MKAEHLEILVEEPSMEAFLEGLLPRMLEPEVCVRIHAYQGKTDLLSKLPSRLRGYANWLPEHARIVVLIDRDNDDCAELKGCMERMAADTKLRTRTTAAGQAWQIVNRIVIEELEAWYFGDWEAVRQIYPKLNKNIPRQESFRDPDNISGGTWEAFERILKKAGYFSGGLRKTEAARLLGRQVDPDRNGSPSFQMFKDAILEAVK